VAEQNPNRTGKGYLTIMQASFDLVLGHAFPFAEFKEPVLSILVCQQFFVKFLAAIWAGIMHKKLGSISHFHPAPMWPPRAASFVHQVLWSA